MEAGRARRARNASLSIEPWDFPLHLRRPNPGSRAANVRLAPPGLSLNQIDSLASRARKPALGGAPRPWREEGRSSIGGARRRMMNRARVAALVNAMPAARATGRSASQRALRSGGAAAAPSRARSPPPSPQPRGRADRREPPADKARATHRGRRREGAPWSPHGPSAVARGGWRGPGAGPVGQQRPVVGIVEERLAEGRPGTPQGAAAGAPESLLGDAFGHCIAGGAGVGSEEGRHAQVGRGRATHPPTVQLKRRPSMSAWASAWQCSTTRSRTW